jgi:hypothetical protein
VGATDLRIVGIWCGVAFLDGKAEAPKKRLICSISIEDGQRVPPEQNEPSTRDNSLFSRNLSGSRKRRRDFRKKLRGLSRKLRLAFSYETSKRGYPYKTQRFRRLAKKTAGKREPRAVNVDGLSHQCIES